MAATITATGTWSALNNTNPSSPFAGAQVNEVLAQHHDTAEQRFTENSLNARMDQTLDVDGFQEMLQFIGLGAQAYAVAPGVIIARFFDILKSLRGAELIEDNRIYAP